MAVALTSDNTVDWDIDTCGVAGSVAQQVHIGASDLLDLSQSGDTSVVLELLLPIGLLWNPVGHCGLNETWADRVDADAVLGPFVGESVCPARLH